MKIAIDGPSGAGKSTVAKLLAAKLDMNYMDTGAMYRAFAYAILKMGIAANETERIEAAVPDINVDVVYKDDGQHVLVDGEDVNGFIRTPEVTKAASDTAVIPAVRLKLVDIQRAVAEKFDMIMDGRDIGTYVLPDADVKFFITADARERARRRKLELDAAGIEKSLDELEQEMIARDKTDSEREFAPLRRAEDAILVDTTDMTIEEVLSFMEEQIDKCTKC